MNAAPAYIMSSEEPSSPLSKSAPKTALLLLDFHKFIIGHQPNQGQPVLQNAASLRKWARAKGIFIVHCLIDLKAQTALHRKMATRVNGISAKMSTAAPEDIAEHADVAALADEYVFWRPPSHVSALGSYGLQSFLAEYGIESLILAGFSSSGCVINTAKQAADSGYIVTAIANACGDKSEEVQRVIMQNLLVGQCHVIDSDVFVEEWDKKDSREVSFKN